MLKVVSSCSNECSRGTLLGTFAECLITQKSTAFRTYLKEKRSLCTQTRPACRRPGQTEDARS
jgi:hypothetical protein